MTKRKTNPKRPRRNARGQFTKARRRPEDYPTTSEMVGYETSVPRDVRVKCITCGEPIQDCAVYVDGAGPYCTRTHAGEKEIRCEWSFAVEAKPGGGGGGHVHSKLPDPSRKTWRARLAEWWRRVWA